MQSISSLWAEIHLHINDTDFGESQEWHFNLSAATALTLGVNLGFAVSSHANAQLLDRSFDYRDV